jgi:glycosyltransferase involved in cell wall biosynthesis
VATAVGAIPELIRDDAAAVLVPPDDPDALAEALTAALASVVLGRRVAHGAISWTGESHGESSAARNRSTATYCAPGLSNPTETSSRWPWR